MRDESENASVGVRVTEGGGRNRDPGLFSRCPGILAKTHVGFRPVLFHICLSNSLGIFGLLLQ